MGYSSEVRLNLKQGEKTYPLRQVAPDWFIPFQRLGLSGEAILSIRVDNEVEEFAVRITNDKQGKVYYERP